MSLESDNMDFSSGSVIYQLFNQKYVPLLPYLYSAVMVVQTTEG